MKTIRTSANGSFSSHARHWSMKSSTKNNTKANTTNSNITNPKLLSCLKSLQAIWPAYPCTLGTSCALLYRSIRNLRTEQSAPMAQLGQARASIIPLDQARQNQRAVSFSPLTCACFAMKPILLSPQPRMPAQYHSGVAICAIGEQMV